MNIVRIAIAILGLLGLTSAALAQSNYQVKPGDTLLIEVLEDPTLNRSALVLSDGSFSFPFAGSVQAGGRTLSQVQTSLKNAIAPNFAIEPNVFISVQQTAPAAATPSSGGRSIDVYFVGEVNAPGLKPMERGTTFLQAVAQNGGFTRFAATKRVQLRRVNRKTGQQNTYTMDFKALGNGAALTNDIVLQDGDVILVPERRLFE